MVNVKRFGIEIQAGDAVAVLQRVVSRIRIRHQAGPSPVQDLLPREFGNLEFNFRGEFAAFPHI